MLNHLIINKLKEIIKLQDIIKTDELYYKSKRKSIYNYSEYSLPIAFLRDIREGYFSLKCANDEQNKFANKLKNIDKDIKSVEKKLFLSNIGLAFTTWVRVLNNFKNRLFPIKNLEPEHKSETKSEAKSELGAEPKYREFSLKLHEDFLNQIVNKEIFRNYFKYQNPLFLVKDYDCYWID